MIRKNQVVLNKKKMIKNFILRLLKIPTYGIFFYLGIVSSAVCAIILASRKKLDTFNFVSCAIYAMIGALLGAKILFILVSLKDIIELNLSLIQIIRGGFVFYGGLIGGALGAFTYSWQFKEGITKQLDIFAVVLPFGHSIGRLGCFFAGCCYGIEYDGIGAFTYESSDNISTPLGVPLFPIQIVESICLFILFLFLLNAFLNSDKEKDGRLSILYLILYSVLRFFLEFLRGDGERGILLGISTSQWISLVLATISFYIFLKKYSVLAFRK